MSMTISYHPSDFFSFRSCPTRLIIQRIVIILCIIYLSYCQLVQSKILVNQRKIENNPIDPMVFDTRRRLTLPPSSSTSTNHHLIVNSTSNRPKLCRYYPTIKKKLPPLPETTIRQPGKEASISTNPNSDHENELTSRLNLVRTTTTTISKLSSSQSTSSSLVKPNKLSINYDQSISNQLLQSTSVYLNSSNGLISTIKPQPNPPSRNHHRRHEKHHHNQQKQQQQQQLNQQQSKCHPIKVHRSKSIYLKPICSKNYIHISGKTVRATKTQHLIDNAFHMTGMAIRGTREIGQLVNFKGLVSGKFICFNKKGKIVAKDNGQWDISCLFREIYYAINKSYKYRSFYNDNWFLGFDFKGRPIRGTINRHERGQRDGSSSSSLRRRHIAQRCYGFSKLKAN